MEPAPATVLWITFASEGVHEARTADIFALDAVLDQIAASCPEGEPVLADVVRANGDRLAIGLGAAVLYPEDDDFVPDGPLTVLSFVAADDNTPYDNSVSAEPFPSDLQFFYNGQDSEFDGRAAVPLADGREAIRRFVTMGEGVPDNNGWEEV